MGLLDGKCALVTGAGSGFGRAGAVEKTSEEDYDLTNNLTESFAPYNVRVNAICPGPSETAMWAAVTNRDTDTPDPERGESIARMYREKAPLGRLCNVNDVANAALFLSSDLASCISGETLSVDAGLSVV